MVDQNDIVHKVDPWATINKHPVSTEAHVDRIENSGEEIVKVEVKDITIESEAAAKTIISSKPSPLQSSSTRSGHIARKPIVPRNDPKPIEPGRLETLPSYTPKNKIEDLKAQGKTFGGAEGKVQEAEKIAAGESAKEESHIVK